MPVDSSSLVQNRLTPTRQRIYMHIYAHRSRECPLCNNNTGDLLSTLQTRETMRKQSLIVLLLSSRFIVFLGNAQSGKLACRLFVLVCSFVLSSSRIHYFVLMVLSILEGKATKSFSATCFFLNLERQLWVLSFPSN